MPYRSIPLVTGEIYHVFNRSIARQPILKYKSDFQRLLDLINFYRFRNPRLRFSHFDRLEPGLKEEFLGSLYSEFPQVSILAFSLMSNHIHFLLRQELDGGIARFMRLIQDSFAKYVNIKSKRTGSVFEAMFKAKRIETDEQLLHVWRYVTLNPATSIVVKTLKELEVYPWSSCVDYFGPAPRVFVETNEIMQSFRTIEKLREFVADQIDYQRALDQIKHLTE